MITLLILFFILTVVFKIVGDQCINEHPWHAASVVCGFITVVLLIIWAVEFHGEAIKHFLINY